MVEVMAQAAARWIVEGGDVVEKEVIWRAAEKAAAQAQVMQMEAEKAEKRRLFAKCDSAPVQCASNKMHSSLSLSNKHASCEPRRCP